MEAGDLGDERPSPTELVPVPPPRRLTSGLDFGGPDEEGRETRFGELERRLVDISQAADEAENRREENFRENEEARERIFLENEARRENEERRY